MLIGDVSSIELPCNFSIGFSLDDKLLEYPSNGRQLFLRTQPNPDTVRLESLVLPLGEHALGAKLFIDPLSPESERERSANP